MAKKPKSAKQKKAQAKLKKASATCRSKGIEPFTKPFGQCVREEYKKS